MRVRALLAVLLVPLAACVTPADEAAPEPVPAPAAATVPPAVPAACAAPGACFGGAQRLGEFDATQVPEASGLSASVRNPGLYYMVDDGESERVWVLDPARGLLGALRVAGMEPRDTESLAVGPCGPGDTNPCVYVGDTGDNVGGREAVRIHRFVEPDLAGGVPQGEIGADSVRLAYPDGVANAEALLVDAEGRPHILTKAPFDERERVAGPARLYRAEGWSDGTLELAGELVLPEPGFGLAAGMVGNVVTGADRFGDRVLVRTYDAVLEYVAPTPGAPLAELPSWPSAEVDGPLLRQPEAVAYTADGCGFVTLSEGSGDVWTVPCER